MDQCAYASNAARLDVVHRLVGGYRALRDLADGRSATRGAQLFGLVLPEHGLDDPAALTRRARLLLGEWVEAMDASARAELANGLAPDLIDELGLTRASREPLVGELQVDLAIDVSDKDDERTVTDPAALARLDGTTTRDVELDHMSFSAAFPEVASFEPRLAFDAPRARLVLRAHFGLAAMPAAARGASLIDAIAAGVRQAKTWTHAEWESPSLGDEVHRYQITITGQVVDARVATS